MTELFPDWQQIPHWERENILKLGKYFKCAIDDVPTIKQGLDYIINEFAKFRESIVGNSPAPDTTTELITCKDCAHLCYEDIGVYYCDKRIITGQLYPDDYCSRAMMKKEENKK